MSMITAYINKTQNAIEQLHTIEDQIGVVAETCVIALKSGNKIILCGNGGSAADSQHIAAELMGRFLKDRPPLPAIALTVDTSALTAIGNDYGYDEIFARQLRGISNVGDVLIGISTSGNSANVIKAFEAAKDLGVITVALTGGTGGRMAEIADEVILVPSDKTNHIQECHITIGHLICKIVEEDMF